MFTVVREQTRPNIGVEFFSAVEHCPPEVIDYWNKAIVLTGKQISSTHKLSDDGLIVTTVMVYRSKDDWHDMTSDKYLIKNLYQVQEEYNYNNNITRVFTSAVESK